MPTPYITRQQSRQIDRRATDAYGMASLILMENAGRGVADVLERLGIAGPVVVCCGKGNNAGDGFVVARHLDLRGHAVRVLVWAEPSDLTGDAGVNFEILRKSGVPIALFGTQGAMPTSSWACDQHGPADRAIQGAMPTFSPACDQHGHGDEAMPPDFAPQLSGTAWIVDALLGTGARGEPRPPLDRVIDQLNASAVPILAVDLPSGLDCDTGQPSRHTIRAAHTCTFVAPKTGFSAPNAAAFTGQIHVLDIGVPRKLVEEVLRFASGGVVWNLTARGFTQRREGAKERRQPDEAGEGSWLSQEGPVTVPKSENREMEPQMHADERRQ